LAQEEQLPISVVAYHWSELPTVAEEKNTVIEADKNSPGVKGAHAGEEETSINLYLQPELVDEGSASWTPGVLGDPSYGTREKGEHLVNAAVNGLVKVLRRHRNGELEYGWPKGGVPFEGRKELF
jgi:creatinine amidohydrolase/Fe(II)-dependent formamide hydrolase-like protein